MTAYGGQLAILAGLLLTVRLSAEPPAPEPPPEALPPTTDLAPPEDHCTCSFTAEADFLQPILHNGLTGAVLLGNGSPALVQPPAAPLTDTVSPRFELAFHLPPDTDFVVTYRSLVTNGSAGLLDPVIGPALLRSRLNLNMVDLDLACFGCGPWPGLDLRWRFGARISDIFFDSGASGALGVEGDSEDFYGIGPHLGLDLWQHLPVAGLSILGRADTAAHFGSIRQSFQETTFPAAAPAATGQTNTDNAQYSPLCFQGSAALDYAPCWLSSHLHVSVGYEYEHWWEVAHFRESRASLTTNGFFVRAEWGF